jgi:DNA-binding transcriptional regulator GbsR (MarR family)
MNKNLLKAQDIFLDRVNQICNKFGLNNIMAQLYAILYLSNKPLSLDNMVERLKISKGSVSTNIRALERYGAVKKVWVRGSRRDYYEADTDISNVIKQRVKSIIHNRLFEINSMIDTTNQALHSASLFDTKKQDKEEYEAIKVFTQRLNELRELHSKIQSLFNLFNSGFLSNELNAETNQNNKVVLSQASI